MKAKYKKGQFIMFKKDGHLHIGQLFCQSVESGTWMLIANGELIEVKEEDLRPNATFKMG